MFAVRALTATVLLAAFFAAVWLLAREAFAAVVALIIALAAREWGRLAGLGAWAGFAYALACSVAFGACVVWLQPLQPAAVPLVAVWLLALLFWCLAVPAYLARGMRPVAPGAPLLAGVLVLLPAGLAAAALKPAAMLALMGLVWVADTAAYLVGRAVGRRKLAPSISPGKTWEGVAGGMLAGLAYAIIVAQWLPGIGRHVSGSIWLAYGAGVLMLCATSVVGDLFESALKRRAGVKDSGSILPGHGGVLDRIDSATAVLPVGALLLAWLEAA